MSSGNMMGLICSYHTQENLRIPSPERLCQQFEERCFPPCSNQSVLPPLQSLKRVPEAKGLSTPKLPTAKLRAAPAPPAVSAAQRCVQPRENLV